MKANSRKPAEFTANSNVPKSNPREHRQRGFVYYFARSESINDACAPAGTASNPAARREIANTTVEVMPEAAAAIADSAVQPPHRNPDKPYKALHRIPPLTTYGISKIPP